MADPNRRGGFIQFKINGNTYDASGDFTYNYGAPKREGMVGPDRVHGYKELPQIPKISGMIRDGSALRVVNEILNATNATVTMELANGKTFMLESAWYCGDGDGTTEAGELQLEMEGLTATEVPA
jgi:hypothetical protein